MLSKKVDIESPRNFTEYANIEIDNTSILFVKNDKLDLQYHTECQENSKYVNGTLQIHQVDRLKENGICPLFLMQHLLGKMSLTQ